MTSSWSTMSEQCLNHIFSFCTYHDLKSMSLVCKSWHSHFDNYVKDKIWLCADKIVLNAKPYEFILTKRTFEKLRISNYIIPTEPYIMNTLSPVSHIRDTKMKFKHLHIDLEDYRILPEILGSVGFTFTHLTLCVKDEKAVDSSILRECKSFKKLECVRHLKIIGFTPEFDKLLKYFKDLKSLIWESSQEIYPYRQVMYSSMPETMEGAKTNFTAMRKALVRKLLEASPNIEELTLVNIVKNFVDLDVLKHLKCLKNFRTNVPGLWKIILDNKSPIEFLEIGGSHIRDKNLLAITTNFKQLKTLGVGFMDYAASTNVLKELWTMPRLNYIHFEKLNITNPDFITNVPNITTLKLNDIELTVDLISAFSKATPNVEFAEMNSIQEGVSFRFFQEMASNWLKLRTLNICLFTKVKFTERDLKFPLMNTPAFEKLQGVIWQTDFVTVPFQFFKSFKAPNLRRVTFFLVGDRSKDEKSNKILPFILANSPLIEEMRFRSCMNLNHDSVRMICKTLKNIKSLSFSECGSLRVGIVRDILKIAKSIQHVNLLYFEEIGDIIDFRVKEHMAKKFLRFGQTVKNVDNKNNPEKKYENAVENLCKARIPHLKLYKVEGLTRFLRGNGVEVVLAYGVDLFKYDTALDKYSDNLKRTFDDIYENVFKPQFRKCGEDEDCVSDDGEKSPKPASKKKPSICPSKIPRTNRKDDKENTVAGNKSRDKNTKKDNDILGGKSDGSVIQDESGVLKEVNQKSPQKALSENKVASTKTSSINEKPLTAKSSPKLSLENVEENSKSSLKVAIVQPSPRKVVQASEVPTIDPQEKLLTPANMTQLAEAVPTETQEKAIALVLINEIEDASGKGKIITSLEDDETKDILTPLKKPLSMKVLAERKFLELPTDLKLKQLEATAVPGPKTAFKIPLTPSQIKDEKKKSTGAKIRNSMISFMSPKLKSNVLKSPIVRRFSLQSVQKSAMECSKALEGVSSEVQKMEVVTTNAVKTPLKVSFDLKEEIKKISSSPKRVVTPRKERRRSKAGKPIFVEESKKMEKQPFIIPEIRITPPEEDLDTNEECEDLEVTVCEEDAKYVSHYYEFSDEAETEDEFFDCEDFENTVMYDDLVTK